MAAVICTLGPQLRKRKGRHRDSDDFIFSEFTRHSQKAKSKSELKSKRESLVLFCSDFT